MALEPLFNPETFGAFLEPLDTKTMEYIGQDIRLYETAYEGLSHNERLKALSEYEGRLAEVQDRLPNEVVKGIMPDNQIANYSKDKIEINEKLIEDHSKLSVALDAVSFGANPIALQTASIMEAITGRTVISDMLTGANITGMDTIRDYVNDLTKFYRIEPVSVFYESGEAGVQYSGFSEKMFDNWIGGDPEVLQSYSEKFGSDFVKNVFAHEMGHHMIDKLGIERNIPRIANEAGADYLAGLYAGSTGLTTDGFNEFLTNDQSYNYPDPITGEQLYPSGSERSALYMQGVHDSAGYVFKNFQSIIHDSRFNLTKRIEDVIEPYV